MVEEIVKTYKSRQSHQNQITFMRGHFNQVRLDKSTTKFKKVQTSGFKDPNKNFKSIIDECRAYKDYEYICSGLNSFQREILIIDCDDNDYGVKTLELMKKDGLIPHYQKVKLENGHSQTGIFIKPVHISRVKYDNGKLVEVNNEYIHTMFKRTYQMLNLLYNGDICYTGFNCQNPLYINANVKSFKNYKEPLSLQYVYDFCLEKISVDDIDRFLKDARIKALKNKKNKTQQQEKAFKIIYKYIEDERVNKSQASSTIITNVTEVIDAISSLSDSYNKDIFIVSTRTCRNFYVKNRLTEENKDIVKRTVYLELQKQYGVSDVAAHIGYSQNELLLRISNDVNQIYQKNYLGRMEWDKVGYTKEQRQRSQQSRSLKSLLRMERIKDIVKDNNNNISLRQIAEIYSERYNDKISYITVKRLLDKDSQNNKDGININTSTAIITNVTLNYSKYNDLNNFYLDTLKNKYNYKFDDEEDNVDRQYTNNLAKLALSLQSTA